MVLRPPSKFDLRGDILNAARSSDLLEGRWRKEIFLTAGMSSAPS